MSVPITLNVCTNSMHNWGSFFFFFFWQVVCEKACRTKTIVYVLPFDTNVNLNAYITHLQYTETRDEDKLKTWLALECCRSGLPIKQNRHPNIWDHGWRIDFFQGWKQATTEALCTYGSLSCVFLWTKTQSLYCTLAQTAKSLNMVQTQHFLLSKRTLWRISVFVLGCLNFCVSPVSIFHSFLLPLPFMSHLSAIIAGLFSVPPFYHAYVVGFATFIENH